MHHKKPSNYRPDIDGLRGIAVILVIIFHAFPSTISGGFIGVDIFIVISGYLITGIILKALIAGEFSYSEFYKKRIKRIFPSLIVVLTACLVAGWFFLFSGEYAALGKNTAAGAGFIANISYWLESGYFDVSAPLKPLLHLWSLGVEEQFYIFWPILLVFFYKKLKKIPYLILFLLGLSFALNLFIGQKDPVAAFYAPITRFWELMSGALLAQITVSPDRFVKKLAILFSHKNTRIIAHISSAIGMFLLIASVYSINSDNFYRGGVCFSVIGTFLIIASGQEAWINKNIFSNRILVFIGLISYPLYLWHWPLLSFANILASETPSVHIRLFLVTISFFLAWGTYQWVEKPIRFGKIARMPLILSLMMLGVCTGGITLYLHNGVVSRFPVQEKILQQLAMTHSGFSAQKYSDGLCKKYQQIIEPEPKSFSCSSYGEGEKKIFIIGDSHSASLFDGYKESLSKKNYTVVKLGLSGCTSVLPVSSNPDIHYCTVTFKKVVEVIKSENTGGILIANNAWPDKENYTNIIHTIVSSLPKNIPIIWFLQTPRVPFELTKCVARPLFSHNNGDNCYFPRKYYDDMVVGYDKVVEDIQKIYPYILIKDPASVICDSEKCPILLNKQFFYFDRGHLSEFGSKYAAKKLPIDQYFPQLVKSTKN